jgi:leucyl-tRNA synthetase
MIYCKNCARSAGSGPSGWQPVPEEDLPVKLPRDVDFLPHGESPIVRSKTFQNEIKCPKCNQPARREVDTMDTYVDSSWYFIRFVDPKNSKEFASYKSIKKWFPIDDYVGGGHVVQHLLFARFFWKVIYDAGLIDKSLGEEPFLRLRAPGWILGSDFRKMSKRWGNVVSPDDVIPKFGADTLRVYEMFMGPFDVMKPWSVEGVEGSSRFLGRVWRLFNEKTKEEASKKVLNKLHQTIKKITDDIEGYKFNTAISSLMELVNTIAAHGADKETFKILALLLAPFTPYMAEEVYQHMRAGNAKGQMLNAKFESIHTQPWPKYDPKLIQEENVTVVIQINGKIRSQFTVHHSQSTNEEEIVKIAKKDEKVIKWLKDKKIDKIIFVPGKIINFVIQK